MKKKILICLSIVLAIVLLWVWWFYISKCLWLISNSSVNNVSYTQDWEAHIVSSLLDDIQADTMWCWTFQVVWNEMLDLIETGVVFSPQLQEAENLNKESFTKEEL